MTMGGPDSFYTPTYLAEQLVGYIPDCGIHSVADFCVGDGRLLAAAHQRFPNAMLFGMDIDQDVIKALLSQHCDWELRVCDFTNDEQVNKIIQKEFDLILLNPPFSCKGSIINIIEFEGMTFKVSTAMMFIMKALRFLSKNGTMYAILPVSCVHSQKDRKAWNYLESKYNAYILAEHNRITFSGRCAPNIALVSIGKPNNNIPEIHRSSYKILSDAVIEVTRGSVRMQGLNYSECKKDVRLIHTTNLLKGRLTNVARIKGNYNRVEDGYGVLIPRVCNPKPQKIVLLKRKEKFVLSDCVIFLRTESVGKAKEVYESIMNNWQDFVQLYSGTGAQYTTIERVKEAFPALTN